MCFFVSFRDAISAADSFRRLSRRFYRASPGRKCIPDIASCRDRGALRDSEGTGVFCFFLLLLLLFVVAVVVIECGTKSAAEEANIISPGRWVPLSAHPNVHPLSKSAVFFFNHADISTPGGRGGGVLSLLPPIRRTTRNRCSEPWKWQQPAKKKPFLTSSLSFFVILGQHS